MSEKTINTRIQIKSDTDANFSKATFVPKKGEPVYYETSKYLKIGDGSTAVNSLPFLTSPNADKLDGYHATSFVKSTGNIGASGYNKYAIVSKSNTNVFPYNKIAHIEGTSSWYDGAMLLYITGDYNGGGFGLLRVSMRSQDQTATTSGYQYAMAEAKWLVRGGLGTSKIIICYNNAKAAWNADVFLITSGAYECYSINQLEAGNRGAVTGTTWTLISASEQANSTSTSTNNKNCYSTLAAAGTYTNTIYSADAGYVQSAGSASSAINASYTSYLGTSTSYYTKSTLDTALGGKQDTLSATGNYTVGTITAGTGSFSNITSSAAASHLGSVGESSKTFLNAYVDNYNAGDTTYLDGSITKKSGTSTYTLTLPSTDGTLLTTGNLYSTDSSATANSVTTTASRTYQIQKNGSGKLVVNVPWSNINTNYYPTRSYTSGLQISGYSGSSNCQLYVPYATTSQYGVVKLGNDTEQTVAANSPSAIASRTYAIQKNSNGQLVVNVPWAGTSYTLPAAAMSTRGGVMAYCMHQSDSSDSGTYESAFSVKMESNNYHVFFRAGRFKQQSASSTTTAFYTFKHPMNTFGNSASKVCVVLTDSAGQSTTWQAMGALAVDSASSTGFNYRAPNTEKGYVYFIAMGTY